MLPLLVAALVFAAIKRAARRLGGRGSTSSGAAPLVLPNLLAVLVFIGGTVLLVSGATPTVAERLDLLAPSRRWP